jgi:hypothetical protein
VAIQAPDVPHKLGGLDVSPATGPVAHSVRDVAIANGIVFACNEAGNAVCMYGQSDGTFLGSSNAVAGPTHLALQNGNLYVSTKSGLFWCQVPGSTSGATCSLEQLQLTPSVAGSIGGVCFDGASPLTAYVVFQGQTGTAGGGSIYSYTVTQASPSTAPVFASGQVVVASGPTTFQDTPEFVVRV